LGGQDLGLAWSVVDVEVEDGRWAERRVDSGVGHSGSDRHGDGEDSRDNHSRDRIATSASTGAGR
jgi:hypothetical protein